MQIPMDIEHKFKWDVCQPKKTKEFEYLSPYKRNKIDIDCTEIIKYLPVKEIQYNKQVVNKKKSDFEFTFRRINFLMLYKCLFYVTDVILSLAFLYVIFQLLYFLQRDILHKIKVKNFKLKKSVEAAIKNYEINRCDKKTRVPALDEVCNQWECIFTHSKIKYTSIMFEVMGEVCSGFLDQISWKGIFILSVFLVLYLKFRNK